MMVKALYFGGLRAALGRGEEELNLPEGSQLCVALARVLSTLGPDWAVALRCAVNEDFAPLDRVLMPGDEVAFLPPVAGGSPRGSLAPLHPTATLPTFVPQRQPHEKSMVHLGPDIGPRRRRHGRSRRDP